MNTLEKIEKLDLLIDEMRRYIAGYGEATRLLRQIKLDVEKLVLPQGAVSGSLPKCECEDFTHTISPSTGMDMFRCKNCGKKIGEGLRGDGQ